MTVTRFRNRQEAGRKLAARLQTYAPERPIIIALPRGGVPVAYEVAQALRAPLDVCVVRKVGVPWHPEFGMGAVAEGGQVYLSREIVAYVGISDQRLSDAIEQKRLEVEQSVRKFRRDKPRPELGGRTVIIVDDGIATGGTVRAVLQSIRADNPKQVVLAVPVAARDTIAVLKPEVDHIIALFTPTNLHAIGLWYEEFQQVSDEEVVRLLERVREKQVGTERRAPAESKVSAT